MKPQDLVRDLLAAEDAQARQALLSPQLGDFYAQVVGLLKDEVDTTCLRDLNGALRIADIAGEVAGFADTPHCRALAAWARGNVLFYFGDYDESLNLHRDAAQFFVADDWEVESARLLSNQAGALDFLGRYDEALQTTQTALAVLRQHPSSPYLAAVLNQLGILYELVGRPEDALAAYEEGADIYSALGDIVNQACQVINIACVLEGLDRFAEALDLLGQARDTLVEQECLLEAPRADLNIAITCTRIGRYDEALEALDRAEQGFAALDNAMEVAVVQLYRADLYAAFNLYDEVLQVPARDWQVFEERGMQWQVARAALHRGVAWRQLGDLARAEELVAQARELFDQIGDPVWTRLADLERAWLWCEMAQWSRALELALEVIGFFRSHSIPIRAAGGSLLAARCCQALDRLEEAAAHYQEVLDTGRELDVPSLLYRAYHGLGRVAELQDRLQDAYEYFRRAVDAVEGLRQRLRVEDYRVGFIQDKLDVYRDAVLACLQMGCDEEAFGYVERAKSGALVDMLLASLSGRGLPEDSKDDDLLARLHELCEELNWHHSKLEGGDDEERGQGHFPEPVVWQSITAVEEKATRAWRQFQQCRPFYASLGQAAPSTPAAVQARLREDEALLQYYVTGDSIYVFVVGHDGLRVCRALACTVGEVQDGADGLDTVLKGVSGFDAGYVATTLTSLSRQMLGWFYDDLVRPLEPMLSGVSRLLVAPDGVLFEIPFHALHNGAEYLIDRYEVAYTPSAGVLRLCQENRERRNSEAAQPLVIGFSKGGDLPHVLQEVEAIAQVFPQAAVYTDEGASLALLQERSGQSALLHLATHAAFRRDNPLFSALQLGEGEWLRAMDLYTLRLNGALVTLSACETGLHQLRGGDLFGLSRGFFCAGASALVASLWRADDTATALLMERFYGYVSQGEPAAAALRQAQQDLRSYEEEQDGQWLKPYAHPFYWAPFCLLGAPDVRV